MNQTMDDSARSTANAWDELTKAGDIGAKQALEALTDGMDVDVTEMTVAELNSLVEAFNAFKAQVGSDMSIEGIQTFFNSIKTGAGEAAAEIQRASDGSWEIDITSIEAVASALGSTEEQARIVLGTLQEVSEAAGNPIKITIDGQPVQTEANAVQTGLEPLIQQLQQKYSIQVDGEAANATIDGIAQDIRDLPRSTLLTITTTYKTVGSPPNTTGTSTTTTTNSNPNGYVPTHPAYKGMVGSMQSMAGGGNSHGGRTLVGELGRELWISRDGKRQKVVG